MWSTRASCIACRGKRTAFCHTTDVTFYPLSEREIADYVASGEPFGKAGAYGIQGPAALFVERICGDYNNIFGLPVARMMRALRALVQMRRITKFPLSAYTGMSEGGFRMRRFRMGRRPARAGASRSCCLYSSL